MNNMFILANESKIKIHFFDFLAPIKGIYFVGVDMPPVIGLDKSLKENKTLLRSIMAEELGHHFTTIGDCIPRKFYNHSNRLYVSKIEYKALRWAANYLIDDNDLKIAIQNGIHTPCELAEFFCVTNELINIKLNLISSIK
jgi:hypothetical protein